MLCDSATTDGGTGACFGASSEQRTSALMHSYTSPWRTPPPQLTEQEPIGACAPAADRPLHWLGLVDALARMRIAPSKHAYANSPSAQQPRTHTSANARAHRDGRSERPHGAVLTGAALDPAVRRLAVAAGHTAATSMRAEPAALRGTELRRRRRRGGASERADERCRHEAVVGTLHAQKRANVCRM